MKAKYKSMLTILLAAAMAFTAGAPAAAQTGSVLPDVAPVTLTAAQGNAVIEDKDEVIYARLSAEGSVQSAYAVNRFTVAQPGTVTDYGAYSSVTNLTGTGPIDYSGETVSGYADAGNFYYQGTLTTEQFPWSFAVSYLLGGVQIAPADIAGKTGKLELRINTGKNAAVNPVFYENYMLQITVTLDKEKCANIQAPGATVASAGKNAMIVYTALPDKEGAYSITAEVQDFTMVGIEIAAMPFSMAFDKPDTDDMLEDFEKLADAISELNDGVGELADGVRKLDDGDAELIEGSAEILDGLWELSENSPKIIDGSAEIEDALKEIATELQKSPINGMDLSQFSQLTDGLVALADGLDSISEGFGQLKSGYAAAYAALNGMVAAIPSPTLDQTSIGALYAALDPSLYGSLDELTATYNAAQTLKGAYDQQLNAAFAAVEPALDGAIGGIDTISDTLIVMANKMSNALLGMKKLDQLTELVDGMAELYRGYKVFHDGLVEYMDGVAELASGYYDFHDGLSTFGDGVGELNSGVRELHDGTDELDENVSDMPDTIDSEIDKLMDQYRGGDFTPVSFLSARNQHIKQVQFVFKCDSIEKPEESVAVQAEAVQETLWSRFIALFKR